MAAKKSLYEILGIAQDASAAAVGTAHQRKLEALQAEAGSLEHGEFSYRRTMLKVALETLSDPVARKRYDDRLAAESAAARSAMAETPEGALAAAAGPEVISQRAEALALRADALSLRADAMSLHADASLIPRDGSRLSKFFRFFSVVNSASQTLLRIFAAVVIVLIVSQVAYLAFAARATDAEKARAEDKIVVQEYYQTYGERPASAAEARALTVQREREEREQRAAEREQQNVEEQQRRFREESRRIGNQVSADLRSAEERMERERAHQRMREAEEERRRAEAEEARLQREQEKWKEVLAR